MSIQTIKDQLRQIRERADYPSLGVKIDLRASRESLKSQLAEAQTQIAEQEKEQEDVETKAEKLSALVQSLIEEHREAVDNFLRSDSESLRVINRGQIPCLWTGWDDLEGTPTASFRSRWERMCVALSRELAYIASKTFPELGVPIGVDSPRLDFRHHAGKEGLPGLPIRECLALYELSDALVSSGFPSQVEEKKYLVNAPSVVQFLESGYANEFPDTGAPSVVGEALRWLSGKENTSRQTFVELSYLPSITFQAAYEGLGELVFRAFLNGDEVEAPPSAEFSSEVDDIMEAAHEAYWTWLQSILDGSPTDPIRKIETGIETGTHISPDYNYWLAAVILDYHLDYHNQPVPQRVREAILSGDWFPDLATLFSKENKFAHKFVDRLLDKYEDEIAGALGQLPSFSPDWFEVWWEWEDLRKFTFEPEDHPAVNWEKMSIALSRELINLAAIVYRETHRTEKLALGGEAKVLRFAYTPDRWQHELPLRECLALRFLFQSHQIKEMTS